MIAFLQYDKKYQEKTFEFIYKTMSEELIVDKETLNKITKDLEDIEKNYIEKNGNMWLAINEETNEIIGTIALTEIEKGVAELRRFYVKKEYRSRKIGYSLYTILKKQAVEKGFTEIYLVSGKELKKAHEFYQRNGWKIVSNSKEKINIYIRDNAYLYKKVV